MALLVNRQESEQPLLDHDFVSTDSELLEEHIQAINSAIMSKETAVQNLKELQSEVEESYVKSRKVRIIGLSGTISGSLFAIIGFLLGFYTFEVSLSLICFAALLSAFGAIIIGCAEAWYMTVSRTVMRNVKIICLVDKSKMRILEDLEKKLDKLVHTTNLAPTAVFVLPSFPSEDIALQVVTKSAWRPRNRPIMRTLFCGCKVFDGIADVTLSIILAITRVTARSAIQIAVRTLWKGLGQTLRAIGIGATVLDVIFIPIDAFVLIKSTYDICKFKNGQGSNSCTANRIADLIEEFMQQKRYLDECQEGSTFRINENSKEECREGSTLMTNNN